MIYKKLTLLKSARIGFSTIVLSLFAFSAQAASVNLVTNGSFENTGGVTDSFSIDHPTPLPGWSSNTSNTNNLDCLIYAGDTTSLCGSAFGGGFTFWVDPGASPDGGNRIGMDADRNYSTALTQTIYGLTAGEKYDVSFWQASAQQRGFNGATTEFWEVKLGNESYLSTLMVTPEHGSIGWNHQTLTFTATASSEVLSFFANGTPGGAPPFALLDGVVLQAHIPEPETYTLLGLGLLSMVLATRRQYRHA